MADADELKEEELKEVAGGSDSNATRTIGNCVFSGHIGQYDAVTGDWVYVTVDGKDLWGEGPIVKSTEEDNSILFIPYTKRIHVFNHFYGSNDYGNFLAQSHESEFGKYAFYGSDVTLYTTMVRK